MKEPYSINVNLSFIGNVRINFYEFSFELIKLYLKENEFERQKKIKHLGVIADVMESSHHSRYEYLMLQCFLVDVVENTYKGTPNAIGSIKIDGKEYSGNSILKSWFLLSNFGHCFKTIGDEKTMLLFTNERKGFKSELLKSIDDPELEEYAKDIISSFDYTKFHHLITIWRLSKTVHNTLKRKQILKIYKLFILNKTSTKVKSGKLDLLKHLATYIREISVISIDGHNTHIPFTINPLSTLMSVDVYESKLKNKSVFNVLEPLVSILVDEVYLDKEVLTKQREYELNSLATIRKFPKNRKGYADIISKGIEKGLNTKPDIILNHFFRFRFKVDDLNQKEVFKEYREIQTVKRNCNNVEASLEVNKISDEKIYDFFINNSFTNKQFPNFVYNICKLLESEFEKTIIREIKQHSDFIDKLNEELQPHIGEEDTRKNIITNSLRYFQKDINEKLTSRNRPGFQKLLTSILSYFIEDRYTFEISDNSIPYDHVAFKLENLDFGHIEENLETALNFETHPDRIHELNHLGKSLKRKFNGFVLCCLCRINIYDFSQSPNKRIITDIDSLVIKVSKENFIIEFNETKNTKNNKVGNAKKDLNQQFLPVLNKNKKGYRNIPVNGFGSKIQIKLNAT